MPLDQPWEAPSDLGGALPPDPNANISPDAAHAAQQAARARQEGNAGWASVQASAVPGSIPGQMSVGPSQPEQGPALQHDPRYGGTSVGWGGQFIVNPDTGGITRIDQNFWRQRQQQASNLDFINKYGVSWDEAHAALSRNALAPDVSSAEWANWQGPNPAWQGITTDEQAAQQLARDRMGGGQAQAGGQDLNAWMLSQLGSSGGQEYLPSQPGGAFGPSPQPVGSAGGSMSANAQQMISSLGGGGDIGQALINFNSDRSRRLLGEQMTEDEKRVYEDMQRRGMTQSGLLTDALGKFRRNYGNQFTDIELQRNALLARLAGDQSRWASSQGAGVTAGGLLAGMGGASSRSSSSYNYPSATNEAIVAQGLNSMNQLGRQPRGSSFIGAQYRFDQAQQAQQEAQQNQMGPNWFRAANGQVMVVPQNVLNQVGQQMIQQLRGLGVNAQQPGVQADNQVSGAFPGAYGNQQYQWTLDDLQRFGGIGSTLANQQYSSTANLLKLLESEARIGQSQQRIGQGDVRLQQGQQRIGLQNRRQQDLTNQQAQQLQLRQDIFEQSKTEHADLQSYRESVLRNQNASQSWDDLLNQSRLQGMDLTNEQRQNNMQMANLQFATTRNLGTQLARSLSVYNPQTHVQSPLIGPNETLDMDSTSLGLLNDYLRTGMIKTGNDAAKIRDVKQFQDALMEAQNLAASIGHDITKLSVYQAAVLNVNQLLLNLTDKYLIPTGK